MKTPAVKGLFAAVAAVVLAATPLAGRSVTLTVDQVRQRYPWNGLIDIDYAIAWESGEAPGRDDNLEVLMVDKSVEPAVTNRAATFLQLPVPLTDGAHHITWNANADGVTNRANLAEFHVKIVHYAEAYMLIDISNGIDAETYPVWFMDHEPEGGFNQNLYKGDIIVLRRIHPGSYVAGSPDDEAGRQTGTVENQHPVMISKPFYIGLFEITQKQYSNVMGECPASRTMGDYCPVGGLFYTTARGGNWPTDRAVNPETFIGVLRNKCRAMNPDTKAFTEPVEGFDLPTEFQWEYACRAGTTKAISTTNDYDNTSEDAVKAELAKVGQVNSQAFAKVGSFEPNPWGLYDMYGNAWELCLDNYTENVVALKQFVDPEGTGYAPERVLRGGSATNGIGDCRSAKRNSDTKSDSRFGIRLCCTMSK